MSVLKLDLTTHDLVRENGSFVRISGGEEIRQNIKVRLLLFKGEAWLNTELGIPYFSDVLKKGINEAALIAIFREAILEAKGVTDLEDLTLDYDPATRALSVTFTALGSTEELAEDLTITDTVVIPV